MPGGNALNLLNASTPTISVGVLSANLLELRSDLSRLERAGVKVIHFDVMDGCFVPVLTVGSPFIKSVRTPLLKDVHLMVLDPLEKVADYVYAGADIITAHVESCDDLRPVLRKLRTLENANEPDRGLVRGVALNPGTPTSAVETLLEDVEMVVLLAVDPRERKPTFDPSVERRFSEVKEMISAGNKEILLCIDGGIKRDNIARVAEWGPDLVVSGSAIFEGNRLEENAQFMLRTIESKTRQADG